MAHRRRTGKRPGGAYHAREHTCPHCNKWVYASRAAARRFARDNHPGEHLRAYTCPHRPDWWHLGHPHPDVIRRGISTGGRRAS